MKAFDLKPVKPTCLSDVNKKKKIDKEKGLERVSLEESRCRKDWKV